MDQKELDGYRQKVAEFNPRSRPTWRRLNLVADLARDLGACESNLSEYEGTHRERSIRRKITQLRRELTDLGVDLK